MSLDGLHATAVDRFLKFYSHLSVIYQYLFGRIIESLNIYLLNLNIY